MGAVHSSATATIANGETTSGAVYVGAKAPVALVMPAAFTGTAMTFQGSADGVTYQAIEPNGAAYSVTVAASKNVPLIGAYFAGFPWIKLVSGSAEAAARSVGIQTRANR